MNQLDVIRGFLELGETGAPSADRLAAEFLEAIQGFGFRHFACCSHVDPFHPPPETVMLHNYPRGWVRTYSEARLYDIDPVLKRAASNPLPFFWDGALHSVPTTKPQQIMMADAAGYGITHGYTVPLHLSWLPGTVRASCTVIPDCGPIDPQSYIAAEMLARYLYFFATRAHAPWLAATQVKLTARERQCLALVAQGKSDWTIGRVLCLSESTVHYHIERLKRRLGVATRTQAVVQAVMTGQISFGDVFRRADDGNPRSGGSSRANLH